jgi:hypothetical protein
MSIEAHSMIAYAQFQEELAPALHAIARERNAREWVVH